MSFQVGICYLGGTMFFQVGLCTPLRTMQHRAVWINTTYSKIFMEGGWVLETFK